LRISPASDWDGSDVDWDTAHQELEVIIAVCDELLSDNCHI